MNGLLRRAVVVCSLGAAMVLAAALATAVPAQAGAPSILRPQSQTARDITDLSLWVLGILVLVFVVVEGLLVISIIRFRRRGDEEPRQIHGSRQVEMIWTVIPSLLIAVIFGLTLNSMHILDQETGDIPIEVTGHQWWWEVGYPQTGAKLANEIHLPAGRGGDFTLTSADVIHSFWVPQLGGKIDVNPGETNHAAFLAATPGVYQGECAEFCGFQHAHMRFLVVVESSADFSAWLKHQAEPAAQPTTPEAKQGQEVFLRQACVGCHAVRGTPAAGTTAPDLTHMGSRRSIAAGTLENDAQNLERWIRDPQAVKPGVLMPTVPMSDAERRAIVAFLGGLK